MGLSQTAAPTTEPVSLDEAKSHVRVDHGEDDAQLTSFVAAAREYVETFTGRQLVTATWTLKLDGFPTGTHPIRLPNPPLSSVTSIQYVDAAGVTQTWSSALYDVDTSSEPGRIVPAWGETYPVARSVIDAVTIVYVAGYGDATAVPDTFKSAILLAVGDLYDNREWKVDARLKVNETVKMLMWSKRIIEAA